MSREIYFAFSKIDAYIIPPGSSAECVEQQTSSHSAHTKQIQHREDSNKPLKNHGCESSPRLRPTGDRFCRALFCLDYGRGNRLCCALFGCDCGRGDRRRLIYSFGSAGGIKSQSCIHVWGICVKFYGKFGVISNSGSSSESVFLISSTGQLSFHSNTSAGSNTTPLDVAVTGDGLFVYTLDAGAGSISEFRLDESTETLTLIGTISDGLTANSGMEGLAAH